MGGGGQTNLGSYSGGSGYGPTNITPGGVGPSAADRRATSGIGYYDPNHPLSSNMFATKGANITSPVVQGQGGPGYAMMQNNQGGGWQEALMRMFGGMS